MGINQACGKCHRAPESRVTANPAKAWSLRFQPISLAQSQCFLRSKRALSCLTCHEAHQALDHEAQAYDKKCTGCHTAPTHQSGTNAAAGTCVECHMPRVLVQANLFFTNHWIGVFTADDYLQPRR